MNSSAKWSLSLKNGLSGPAAGEGLAESLDWLIRQRWFAVAGVCATAFIADRVFGEVLPYSRIYAIAAALGLYNFGAVLLVRAESPAHKVYLAKAQVPVDLAALAALLHYAGGVENPFAFYFVFHIIIASVLLSRRASLVQAGLASALFAGVALAEYAGLLPHYCVFPGACRRADALNLLGTLTAVTSTLFIAAYMASAIAIRLRQKEAGLREANERLREADKIKSNYVLRVTHDVKEHLAAIQACLDPVLAGLTGDVAPAQRGMIQRSYDRAGKLMSFVKALLEITRIKLSRRMETGDFSLRQTVENAVSHVEARAKARGIALTWGMAPGIDELHGSQIYIEETVANFLANAVKYTPEGGRVDLRVEDAGESVLVKVTDTGIGIPAAELPHLFEEFFRASNAKAAERNGTGLGLSIAKEVAQRHGGRVWVESVEGKGSTFYFSLPKKAPAAGAPAAAQEPANS